MASTKKKTGKKTKKAASAGDDRKVLFVRLEPKIHKKLMQLVAARTAKTGELVTLQEMVSYLISEK